MNRPVELTNKKFLLIILLLIFVQLSAASWWNDNYQYRRTVDVTNQENYQIYEQPVQISFSPNGHMQSDCDDIRVRDPSSSSTLTHELVSCSPSGTTQIEVALDANGGATESLEVYYGYSGASSTHSNVKSNLNFLIYNDNMKFQGSGVQCEGSYGTIDETSDTNHGVDITRVCDDQGINPYGDAAIDRNLLENNDIDVFWVGRSRGSGTIDESSLKSWSKNNRVGLMDESSGCVDNTDPGTGSAIQMCKYFGYTNNPGGSEDNAGTTSSISKSTNHPIWSTLSTTSVGGSNGLYDSSLNNDIASDATQVGDTGDNQNPMVHTVDGSRTYAGITKDFTASEDEDYFYNAVKWTGFWAIQDPTVSVNSEEAGNSPPNSPSNPSPPDGDSDTFSNTLNVDVSDPDGDGLDVTFYGREQGASSWDNLGTDNGVSDGSTASISWDRNSQSNMYGFDRGGSYEWAVEIDDGKEAVDNLGSPYGFSVLDEATLSSPTPTGGDNSNYLNVTIDNPSNRDTDVEFWIRDGADEFKHATDTVTGGSGTASVSVENFELQNVDTGEWYVKLDDGKSKVDYSTSLYGNKDYDFVTARPPKVKPDAADSYPVNTSSVGLDTDLQIYVEDPDNSDMNVTFFQGSPGSNQLGDPVTVTGGGGVATLPSDQHNLGSSAGDSFEWSVEAEDVEYNEVNQSSGTYSVDIVESPQVSFISHNNGDTDVSVSPTLEASLSQAEGKDLSWRFDVDGGGQNLSNSGIASGTSGGTSVSHNFGLNSGSDYTWKVNASFPDEFGNTVWTQESISFTTASAPSLLDFSPVDQADGQVDPMLEVDFDNSGRATTVRFYNWENGNQLHEETGITNGIATFNTSTVEGFGGEARDTYFWYVRIIDEASGASYNSSAVTSNPWEFSTPNVLDARIDVVQGTRNLNPGSANLGPSSVEFRVSNNDSLDMDKAAVSLNGSNLVNVSPVSEGESISVNIADEVSEDNSYDWSVDILEDGNLIAQTSREFSTYVISADWDKPSESVQDVSYNVYHSNEDTPFNFGGGDYSHIGEAYSTTVDIATTDLGYGSTDCFRITSENIVGESTDSAPPLGGNGECLGGNLE